MRIYAKQARLQVSARRGVLSVGVSGLVTAGTIEQIRLMLAPIAPQAGAVWIDYTRAAIAVTDLELQGLATPIAAGARSIPMAWAVSDDGTAELWARQSLRLALHGHRRFVAMGVDQAAAWAAREIALGPMPAGR